MTKEIEIQGCVSVPKEVSMDDFIDKFIAFIEENRWSFGGGYRTMAAAQSSRLFSSIKYVNKSHPPNLR